jgi:hypothetical protein
MNTTTYHKLLETSLAASGLVAVIAATTFGCEDDYHRRRSEVQQAYDAGLEDGRRDRVPTEAETEAKAAEERKAALKAFNGHPGNTVVCCRNDKCQRESYLMDWTDLDRDVVFTKDKPNANRNWYLYTCPHCWHGARGDWDQPPPLLVPAGEDPRRARQPIMSLREWKLLRLYDECGRQQFKSDRFGNPVIE